MIGCTPAVCAALASAWDAVGLVVDAVDVAFTEAAVGAGMSTVVLLGAMLLTSRTAKPEKLFFRLGPMLVCLATGAG